MPHLPSSPSGEISPIVTKMPNLNLGSLSQPRFYSEPPHNFKFNRNDMIITGEKRGTKRSCDDTEPEDKDMLRMEPSKRLKKMPRARLNATKPRSPEFDFARQLGDTIASALGGCGMKPSQNSVDEDENVLPPIQRHEPKDMSSGSQLTAYDKQGQKTTADKAPSEKTTATKARKIRLTSSQLVRLIEARNPHLLGYYDGEVLKCMLDNIWHELGVYGKIVDKPNRTTSSAAGPIADEPDPVSNSLSDSTPKTLAQNTFTAAALDDPFTPPTSSQEPEAEAHDAPSTTTRKTTKADGHQSSRSATATMPKTRFQPVRSSRLRPKDPYSGTVYAMNPNDPQNPRIRSSQTMRQSFLDDSSDEERTPRRSQRLAG